MTFRTALGLISALLLPACATPIPPPGGPRDITPPEIAESIPSAGAVNVTDQTIRLTFSEHIDQTSFARAITITPSFERPLEFSWRGRAVTIEFPEPLRENTTYLFTLDNNLRDIHGVALASPITLAFSTGPTISRGLLSGRVLQPGNGEGVAGVDVFAYALADSVAPDSLPRRPDYRTQTGTDGSFRFEYLTEGLYFVAAVRDANRNATIDSPEAFAPPPVPAMRADTVGTRAGTPWVLANVDTVPPEPQRVQPISQARHALRLSEEVRFLERDPLRWSLADSSSGASRTIERLYMASTDRRQVIFLTSSLEPATYSLMATALADTSDNPVRERVLFFTPSTAPDTVQTRFLSFFPPGSSSPVILPRGIEPGIRFNEPVDTALLSEAVTVRDTIGTALVFNAVTRNGTDYEIIPEPALLPGSTIVVDVDGGALANPDSVYSITFQRISADLTGELAGVVAGAGDESVLVELHPVEVDVIAPMYAARADATGNFIFRDVPAGAYRLRAYVDTNQNGRWDVGSLIPYNPSELLTWRNEPARVRARWETALPDTLRMPTLSDLP